jgi:ATP-dependent RNA helicase DeaD
VLSEETSEEDLMLARALLAERSAEDVAAALVRMYRARLPSPEDVTDPGFGREPRPARIERPHEKSAASAGAPSAPMRHRGPGVWFRLDIGRRNNADPKWLLPMICKRGQVSRDAIGAIRIFDRETKFEIASEHADAFAAAMLRPGKPARDGQDEITFTRLEGGAPAQGEKMPFRKKAGAKFDKQNPDKPRFEKPNFDKAKFDKPKFKKAKPGKAGVDAGKARTKV